MPADSTNSTFPTALDHLPTIAASDSEQAAGIEHDVMHDKANGAINALQALLGITGSTDPATVLGKIAQLVADKLDASAVGATVAPLVSGTVPSAYLPSYVDDVIEVADEASLPTTGETGKLYITIDTGAQYRWSGSVYVQLTSSPGTTDAVPEGTTHLYFTDARAYAAVKASLQAGTHSGVSFSFNDGAKSISVTAALPANTDALGEGSSNLYFTDARAYAAIKASIQAGTHSGVSFSFNDGAKSISVTASGGGGGSSRNWSIMQWGSSSSTNYACKGHILLPYDDFNIDAVSFYAAEVSGKTYCATLYELNSSFVVQSVLADIGPVTAGSTASVRRVFEFSSPVSLQAGHTYAILHRRTSDTGTTSSGLYAAVASTTSHLAAPLETGGLYCYFTASVAPGVGDTLQTNTGTPWNNGVRVSV